MTSPLLAQRRAWDAIVQDQTIISLQERALKGTLCELGLRSVCWKIFLGYLPLLHLRDWSSQLTQQRQRYQNLRQTYIEEPEIEIKNSQNATDLSDNNPLALNESNPWQKYFENQEIRKIIRQDVDRTLPEQDFFRRDDVQTRMTDILFVYCKSTATSYSQGMHELLAWIYWVVATESLDASDDEPEMRLMLQVLDVAHVEHDAYILFESLMQHVKPWYRPPAKGMQSNAVTACNRVQYDYLSKADPFLYKHLKDLHIEPQLYGIRWLRLLFGREFEANDLLKLWDAMFAISGHESLSNIAEYVAVAFLLQMRDDLISERENIGCLTLLMRNSIKLRPDTLVSEADRLRKNLTTVTALEILQENDRIRGKPPRFSLTDGLESLDDREVNIRIPKNRLVHQHSQGFADVFKRSPKVQELNKTLEGVMKNMQRNAQSLGENVRSGLPVDILSRNSFSASGDHRWQERASFDFPPGADRVLTRAQFKGDNPTLQNSRSASRQMGELMEKCIEVMEKGLFLDDAVCSGHQATDDPSLSSPPKANEAAMVMALAGLKHVRDVLSGKQGHFDPTVFDIDSLKKQRSPVSTSPPLNIPNSTHSPLSMLPSNPASPAIQSKHHQEKASDSTTPITTRKARHKSNPVKPQHLVETQDSLIDPLDAKNVDKKTFDYGDAY